jgi:hypothetical protein
VSAASGAPRLPVGPHWSFDGGRGRGAARAAPAPRSLAFSPQDSAHDSAIGGASARARVDSAGSAGSRRGAASRAGGRCLGPGRRRRRRHQLRRCLARG